MAPAEHGPDLSAVVQAAMQAATVTAQLTRYGLVDADRLADLDERCGWMPGTFEAFIEGLCDFPKADEAEPMTDEEWRPFADALGIDPFAETDT